MCKLNEKLSKCYTQLMRIPEFNPFTQQNTQSTSRTPSLVPEYLRLIASAQQCEESIKGVSDFSEKEKLRKEYVETKIAIAEIEHDLRMTPEMKAMILKQREVSTEGNRFEASPKPSYTSREGDSELAMI